VENGELKKHTVGVYFQNIPQDPMSGWSSLEYKDAEARGYFKIDFLNLAVYKKINSEAHLQALMAQEPAWEMLESEELVDELFHLNGHYDVVMRMQPKTIMQLAMVLALIRPGKRHLIGKPWSEVEKSIWVTHEEDAYTFKKAHALSYAFVVAVQMNLMVEGV
jgi:DNA polymerase III alpha subunit